MPRDLITLQEALERLPCGRTKLLSYLAEHPHHDGKPTHRRIGNRIVFTEADLATLIESFAPPSRKDGLRRPISASPSADRAYKRAMALLEPSKEKRR